VPEHLIIRIIFLSRRVATALAGVDRHSLITLVEAQAMNLRGKKAASSSIVD
jgi:hypothetical protein